jgi:pheromone shutdown-related protein TraB
MNSMNTKIQLENKTITLIGTAHVSHQSAQEVLETLSSGTYDAIAIELDEERYKGLNQDKSWENTDIIQLIKQKKTGLLMAQLVLASYQKRIAKANSIQVGQEMMTAIDYANGHEIRLLKIDRSVTVTFQRIWSSLNFFDKMSMLTQLITSVFTNEEISEADLEKLKEQDILQAALSEISTKFPKVAEALIFERDRIMAYKLRHAPGQNIVAIVGAAHVSGIVSHLDKPNLEIKDLMVVPPTKASSKILTYIFPLSIVALIVITMIMSPNMALNTIIKFIVFNGSLAALGTLLAFGHPVSIITAFIAAPIGILSPVLATGWFAGIAEATMRKPKVTDFMNLQDEAMHLKGWWKNRVLRILLVVMMANIFASFGSIMTSIDLFKNLFK